MRIIEKDNYGTLDKKKNKAFEIIRLNAHLIDDIPIEMNNAIRFISGDIHTFSDFIDMANAARNYISFNNYKAVWFQDSQYFGFSCFNDGTIFNITLRNAFKSIYEIEDDCRRKLFERALYETYAKEALTDTISKKHIGESLRNEQV